MRVTLNDIASSVGVSRSLVSMYLNKHPLSARIADATKRRIDETVAALGYRPSFAARALSKRRSGTSTIGMICGGIRSPYFANLAADALETAAGRGYQLLLSITRWRPEEELKNVEALLSRQVDAILCAITIAPGSELEKCLRRAHIPVCQLNIERPPFYAVNRAVSATADALRALRAHGHTRVFCALPPTDYWGHTVAAAAPALAMDVTFAPSGERDFSRIVATVLRDRPAAIMVNGPLRISRLLTAIDGAAPRYTPDIVIGCDAYTYPAPHPCFFGAICTETRENIDRAISHLVDVVEGRVPDTPGSEETPARFVPRGELPEILATARDWETSPA